MTTEFNLPLLAGLSADQLLSLLRLVDEYRKVIVVRLPHTCAGEGHQWDHPRGNMRIEREGAEFVRGDPDGYLWNRMDHWEGGEDVTYFIRTCTRCGHVEKALGIEHVELCCLHRNLTPSAPSITRSFPGVTHVPETPPALL